MYVYKLETRMLIRKRRGNETIFLSFDYGGGSCLRTVLDNFRNLSLFKEFAKRVKFFTFAFESV